MSKRQPFVTGIATILVLAASGSAVAQSKLDSDGDGAISLEEWQAARPQASAERFHAMDTNGDGLIGKDELFAGGFRQHRPEAPRERLAEMDTDHSGGLSLAELQARRPELTAEQFGRLDRNGDGQLGPGDRMGRGPGAHPGPGGFEGHRPPR